MARRGTHAGAWTSAGLVLSTAIFLVDARIPPEIAISPLYLFPVAMVAWFAGLSWAIAVAVVAGGQWIGAEVLAGAQYSSAFVYVWNTTMRFGTFVVVATLVARVRDAHDDYRDLSRHDPVTHALNNRAFREELARELERARRHQRALTLVYIDLDNFKGLNDQFGHVTGDTALAAVAGALVRHTRKNDLVARVGGDEFAVLLVDVTTGQVQEALARLRQGLLDAMSARQWLVTFSIGAVTFNGQSVTPEQALHAADELMYTVKRSGKNAVRHETRA